MEAVDSREFVEWMAFRGLEPDPARETVRLLAQLMTLMANVHRDHKYKPVAYTLDDFLPNPYGPSRMEREAGFAAVMADYAKHSKHKAN